MVFYRKYRPQTIEQLDSVYVRDTLRSLLSSSEIPHAFLFTGPKGLGKTSTARIVAKVVNCEKKKQEVRRKNQGKEKGKPVTDTSNHNSLLIIPNSENIEPCNECAQCLSITNGTNLDVMEIDAASNRGIDEIRDLREKLRLAPVAAKKKVYIIDEVHMLTTEAFNALLKTLEEPPAHVMFVLCTTEPQKVPATILSRCLHVTFSKATPEELVRSFTRIVTTEGLHADNEALLAIAQLSDGGFRDGAKILEELSLFATDKTITKELIESKYRVTSMSHHIVELLVFLEKQEAKQALGIVAKLSEQGTDMKYFIEQLVAYVHQLLLVKIGVLEGTNKQSTLSVNELKQVIALFTQAYTETKYTPIPQLPLELAIIEYFVRDKQPFHISQGKQEAGEKEQVTDNKKQVTNHANIVRNNMDVDKSNPSLRDRFVNMAKKENQTIAGLLRSCFIVERNGVVVIEAKFPFHKEKLQEKNSLVYLEKIAGDVIGKKVSIEVQLSS